MARGNGGSLQFRDELHEPLIARARELRPLLTRNAAAHEVRGELTPEVVAALEQADLFKMSVPRRWGGLCVSSATMREVTAELARGCPSTSWVVSIITNNLWTVSTLSDAMQKLVFSDGIPCVCGPQNGTGRVERRGDSFVVNGRWSYGSGSHHSSWAIMPAVFNGDKCIIASPPPHPSRIARLPNCRGAHSWNR